MGAVLLSTNSRGGLVLRSRDLRTSQMKGTIVSAMNRGESISPHGKSRIQRLVSHSRAGNRSFVGRNSAEKNESEDLGLVSRCEVQVDSIPQQKQPNFEPMSGLLIKNIYGIIMCL